MTVGTSLSALLDLFRAEAGMSTNVANNQQVRSSQIALLNRVQRQIADEHDWQHLWVQKTLALAASQYAYTIPTGLNYQKITDVWYVDGEQAFQLGQGVTPADLAREPFTEPSWPPRAWRVTGDSFTTLEIWPTPDRTATAYVTGYRIPPNMSADSDTTILDADIIAMTAAAEVLGRQNQADAALRLETANKRIRMLIGQQGAQKEPRPALLGGGLRYDTWYGRRRFRVPGEGL